MRPVTGLALLLLVTTGVAGAQPRLPSISAAAPDPQGDVLVRLARVGARGVRAEVTLPPGTTGTFVHEGRRVPLRAGRQEILP